MQVQDTLDPEYYVGAYQRESGGWATAKFRDCLPEAPAAGTQPHPWERRPLYCVRVPGEAAWAAGEAAGAASTSPGAREAPARQHLGCCYRDALASEVCKELLCTHTLVGCCKRPEVVPAGCRCCQQARARD